MMYWVSLICSCIVTGYVFFAFIENLYERKYSNKYIYFLAIITFCTIDILIVNFKIPLLNITFITIIFIIISYRLYKVREHNILVNVLAFVIYLFLVDLSVTVTFSFLSQKGMYSSLYDSSLFFVSGLANMLFMICTYRPFIHILMRYKISKINFILYVYMFFLLIFEVGVIYYEILKEKSTENNITILIICIGFFFIDSGILYLYQIISKYSIIKERTELLEQQKKMMIKYSDELQDHYNKSRKMLHDVKKHLSVIANLESLDLNLRKTYIDELMGIIDELSGQFECKNRIINAIIWDKIRICKNENIKFNINMQDIEFSFMDDIDITVLFANLLDNAVEACKIGNKEDIKKISLWIHKFKYYVVIKLQNTSFENLNKSEKRILSTKNGHEGLGLEIIQNIAEKYGGNMNCIKIGKQFEIRLVLLDVKGFNPTSDSSISL